MRRCGATFEHFRCQLGGGHRGLHRSADPLITGPFLWRDARQPAAAANAAYLQTIAADPAALADLAQRVQAALKGTTMPDPTPPPVPEDPTPIPPTTKSPRPRPSDPPEEPTGGDDGDTGDDDREARRRAR